MKFGTSFPITATNDIPMIRDFAQTLDGAGFDYVTLSGHVVGAPADRYDGRPNATYTGPFYDPFVLFSYLAGITERLGFMTSILIVPLFPTVLVAKQALELSILSNGRLELGLGISWQEAEYRAMGQDLRTRGKRQEEQIEVLRLLWSQPYVTYKGRWHDLDNVGFNRLPPSPIPLWIGCSAEDRLLNRVARLADGWMPLGEPTEAIPRLRDQLTAAGRDASTFRIAGRLAAGTDGTATWLQEARRLQALGVTHLGIGAPAGLSQEESLKLLVEARRVLAEELAG